MKLFSWKKRPEEPAGSTTPQGGYDYSHLITDHLPFIEKQCRRAVATHGGAGVPGSAAGLDNEADELFNGVLDRLRENDFRVLRDFKGEAKLTTYLTSIIANLVIDLAREKKGRSRARERAREMGGVAEQLYDLVFSHGLSLHEAHGHLETAFGITEPLEKLRQMLERMRGRERGSILLAGASGDCWLVPGTEVATDEGIEVIVTDPRPGVEELLISRQERETAQRVMAEALAGLSGEERLMLRMRFPEGDEEEPLSNRDIGLKLGMSEKAVDSRIRRVLARCRETMLRAGLALDDLINIEE